MPFIPSAFTNVISINVTDQGRAAQGLSANGNGSGVIIGAHAILTAAHVVTSTLNSFSSSKIGLGTVRGVDNIFSTSAGGQAMVLAKGYDIGLNYEGNDYAVIAVSVNLTKFGTPMKLGTPTVGQSVHITGYPASVRGGGQQDVIVKIDAINLTKGEIAYSSTDVTVGNSGGPLWDGPSNNATVYGIQSSADFSNSARFASAMTADAITNITRLAAQADSLFRNGPVAVSADQNKPGLVSTVQIDDLTAQSYTGTANRDRFIASNKATSYDGGQGFDTVVYSFGNRSDYKIENIASTASGISAQVTLPNGRVNTVTNVERMEFNDATIAFDTSGNAGQVYRLYQAAFKRAPDTGGLSYWIKQADASQTLESIAKGFTGSPEYQSLYGVAPTSAQIVDRYYKNVLGRAGEPGGTAFWTNVLETRQQDAAQVLIGFSESPENQSQLIGVISGGIHFA
jgi:V8-like Glu-specific endopeptidase